MRLNPPERVPGDSNVFVRENTCTEAGDVVQGHTHHFDHVTYFGTGRWHLKATLPDGRVVEMDKTAPDWCLIRAGVEHEITALEPGTFHCIYAHRTPQGSVVESFTGWPDAYN